MLRLLRDPALGALLEREAVAMRAAFEAGVAVPAVGELTTREGRPGLVMDRVEGPDFITALGRPPWKILAAAGTLAEVHAKLHETIAPDSLSPLREFLRWRISAVEHIPADLVETTFDRLDRLPDGDRLCHGDFHPGNLLLTARGPMLIDWTNAARGDPTADVAWTRLLFDVAQLQPSAPALVRMLNRFGRSAMYGRYLGTYRRLRPVDEPLMERWYPVLVVDRLVKGIDAETPMLIALARRLYEGG